MKYMNRIVALVSGPAMIAALVAIAYAVDAFPFINIRIGHMDLDEALTTAAFGLFSLAWYWVTLRWLARPPRVTVWWCFGGLVVAFLCSGVFETAQWHYWCVDWHSDYERQYHHSFPSECPSVLEGFLSASFVWKAGSMFLAFISGLAAAAAIVLKSKRITARAVPA
jgi:hypothetical protein